MSFSAVRMLNSEALCALRFVGLCVQIETCPCGHEAQMWEKVLGGESGERYLCFTKQDKVSTVSWEGCDRIEEVVNRYLTKHLIKQISIIIIILIMLPCWQQQFYVCIL